MAENQLDEKHIIARAREGDGAAKAEIVRNHEQMVYSVALRLLGDSGEAECVLQETFLKVFTGLANFRGDSELSTWIYRIATNFALMRLRSRKKEKLSINHEDDIASNQLDTLNRSLSTDPLAAVMNEELRAVMDRAIERLPHRFRTAFVLKDIEGLSLKQISDILNIKLPTVKSNLRRARLFLRNHLAEYFSSDKTPGNV